MKVVKAERKLLIGSVFQEKGGTTGATKGLGYAVGLNDCDEKSSALLGDFSMSLLFYNILEC